jgi:hypothetical protein
MRRRSLYAFDFLADGDVDAMGFPNLHLERSQGRLIKTIGSRLRTTAEISVSMVRVAFR